VQIGPAGHLAAQFAYVLCSIVGEKLRHTFAGKTPSELTLRLIHVSAKAFFGHIVCDLLFVIHRL